MNLITFNDVYKQFQGEYILKKIDFSIDSNDKIGLIGLNGVGKTTLIKMILGIENFDGQEGNINKKGNIFINPNIKIGYLSQMHNFHSFKNTVYEELLENFSLQNEIYKKLTNINIEENYEEYENLIIEYERLGGYEIEYKIKAIMQGLELNNYKNQIIESLSGGEKTRISLAKLLLQEPDLLILDEPTNHLDILSIEWLEDYLKKYNKAFILISHDRIFLDEVCNKIFEIENKKLYEYNGNFSDFVLQKEMILKGEIKRFEKETEKIKKMEEYIKRYKAGIKSKQARGRQKILDRMEKSENPIFNIKRMKLNFDFNIPLPEKILEVNNISKSFDDKKILNNISFNVYRGDKIGIIGKNGIGKSSLLKILTNKIKQDEGMFLLGDKVKYSYYDQDHQNLYLENNILQEINTSLSYTEENLRSLAASFLFTSEDLERKIKKLSGGEKVRLTLLKLIQEKGNFLLLDEPTNHLDIYSMEVLEEALIDFQGSFLLISHNRYFLDSVCNKIFYLSEDGIEEFKGNYSDYKKNLKNNNVKIYKRKEETDYFIRKENQKKENKIKRDIEKLEKEIESISSYLLELEEKMQVESLNYDVDKIMKIHKEIEKAKIRENELIEMWVKLLGNK